MNIFFDLEVEYSNNYIKQGINNLGVNVIEYVVIRIVRVEKFIRIVFWNIDRSLQRLVRLGKYVVIFFVKDLDELVKKLVDKGVFQY